MVHRWFRCSLMPACVFPTVEYLHSMSCSCLLPRNVGSVMSWPLGLEVYATTLIRSSLWCTGLWYAIRIYFGIVCNCFGVFGLSSCKP